MLGCYGGRFGMEAFTGRGSAGGEPQGESHEPARKLEAQPMPMAWSILRLSISSASRVSFS